MKNTFSIFFFFCLLLIVLNYALSNLLNIDKLIYASISETYTENQVKKYFELKDKWQWVSYVFIPVYMFLKIIIISSILYIGTFFLNRKEVTFKKLFSVELTAEFIFLLVPVFKILWFTLFQTQYNLQDVQYFYPLSALNITGYKDLQPWLLYPFQVLNLFEVAYIILLSYLLGKLTHTNTDTGLKIVSYSYIPALLLWVCVVMFFTLNYS